MRQQHRLALFLFFQWCCLVHSTPHTRRLRNKTFGNVRVLVLLVRFTNHATRPLPPREHFQQLCEVQLAQYLQLQSYEQYNLTGCDVFPWTTTTVSETEFAAGERGFFNAIDSSKFFTPLLDQLTADTTVDWTRYDEDQDGELDALLVFHSGFPSEGGDGDACGEPPRVDRIRSQAYWSSTFGAWSNDFVTLNGYAVASAYDGVCDLSRWVQLAVPAHEFLHTFETVDLYDTRNGFLGGLGGWDIMANPFGPVGDTMFPGSMSPWSRALTGWHAPREVTADGIYELRPSNRFPDALKIARGFPSREYLLIENRQPLDFDQLLFGNGGILIYHIDDTKFLQETPGYPGQEGWPRNGNHYRVALLPADGEYHLERGINNGDAGDLWTQGMVLRPGTGSNFPNTDSYQGGQILSTGITIEILSPPGPVMQVRITGVGPSQAPTAAPRPTASPTEEPIIMTLAPTTLAPTTLAPTTLAPTTLAPTTIVPMTVNPTVIDSSIQPSSAIEMASIEPTLVAALEGSTAPSQFTTESPSTLPTESPTPNETTVEPNLNNVESSSSSLRRASCLFLASTVGFFFL